MATGGKANKLGWCCVLSRLAGRLINLRAFRAISGEFENFPEPTLERMLGELDQRLQSRIQRLQSRLQQLPEPNSRNLSECDVEELDGARGVKAQTSTDKMVYELASQR